MRVSLPQTTKPRLGNAKPGFGCSVQLLEGHYVCCLRALRAVLHDELDPLAFIQVAEARALDGRIVREDIRKRSRTPFESATASPFPLLKFWRRWSNHPKSHLPDMLYASTARPVRDGLHPIPNSLQ